MSSTESVRNTSNVNWKKSPLLKGLSKEHLDHLESKVQDKVFKSGTYIINDGDEGKDLYIVEQGEVAIKKDGILLATKSAGEHFGAMAMLDGSIRSADVIATSTCNVKSLSVAELKKLDGADIYNAILTNHVREQQADLRNMNLFTVGEVKAKLAESEARLRAGSFFVTLIFSLIIYQWLLGAFIEYTDELKDDRTMAILNPLMIILMCVVSYLKAVRSGLPLSEYGLNLNNWKRNLIESLLWTGCFMIILVLFKWILVLFVPAFEGRPIIDYSSVPDFTLSGLIWMYIAYALMCPFQEFVARGVIQTSLQQLLTGERKLLVAILLSNLAFSSFHIHLNMKFALLTLIPGVFWGIMYYRQKSLLGVSISHAIIGLFVFICMGLS